MASTITGRIVTIKPTVQVTTKSQTPYHRRDIVLDCGRERNGQYYENSLCFTFTQNNVGLLDRYAPGQYVTITYEPQGRYYEPKDSYFTDLRGWKIEPAQQQMPQQYPPQQAYPQQYPPQQMQPQYQQPQYQQPVYPQQPQYQQPVYPQQPPMQQPYPQQAPFPQDN